ncbi:thiosulfate/3-mercaptopyruvate sulfurtransferase [Alkalithermobacter thermoalcaliphilus JW-YL-7 = DSM 7308]|uniref:Sulfurtransferase n=1 Tax=Alkalithermobacter thermoalcaliphilus JW-YL-7 = DSM 7308 TaxID=1121328 RepID=A0A150FQN6_CLOPD|nr:3-mercaptopyruvate sulfurtransferase [[Clostridium] paradoxum JW-YL-7 = DSM 7308]SHK77178.1 thiosulfate/3-mercaptopyruvate sulfurtransferase [[Clostridium] paradoxum JW-YL-7 = DSM 7308]
MKKILALVLTLLVTLGAVGCNKVEVKSEEELKEQKRKYADYHNPDVLISALEAKELMESGEKVVVVDIRPTAEYVLGHIPGAIDIWRPSYESKNYPFGGMAAEREEMEKFLGSIGIDNETLILAYDAKGDYDAARLWWILDMYGYDNIKLIDGGLDGWKAAGLSTRTGARPAVTPTEFKFPNPENKSKLATLEDVKAAINDPNVIILDTRSLEEATGEKRLGDAKRAGRIPTSVWVEYVNALNPDDNTFKTAQELKALFEENGITPDKTIIAYCQSAVRSAHTTFVLTQLLGYENVKNYDGSWLEWSMNEDLEIETGALK